MNSKRNPSIFIFAVLGLSLAFSAYAFLVSFGTWTKWPTSTAYYHQLAVSFRQSRLHLGQTPSAELLALSNPYDPVVRAGVSYPQDVSLYEGKFYLYFGPVPALILMIAQPFASGEIGDQYLVFGFAAGLLLVQILFLLKFLQRNFTEIPAWFILPATLVTGLTSPLGWVLSLASVYNASILGGQFFFFGGLYMIYCALDRRTISKGWLASAGLFWVLAIGSRMTQIIPVGFVTIITLGWIIHKERLSVGVFKTSAAFVLPLVLGTICLGWYNWARFGSVFEFGTTYQLAGPDLQKHQDELFSPSYFANNVYNYFLIKPEIKGRFPFLNPVGGYNEPVIKAINLPDVYFSQETAGLLFIAPFLIFSILCIASILVRLRRVAKFTEEATVFDWLLTSLLGAFLASLLFFLLFFWAGVRYQAEFIPALAILGTVGFWEIHCRIPQKAYAKVPYTLLGLALMAVTVVNSTLIAFAIASSKYREFNPELWAQLIRFFGRLFEA